MQAQDASLMPLSPNNECIHKMKVHAHSLIKSILTEENGEESAGWEFVALKKGVAISYEYAHVGKHLILGQQLNKPMGGGTFHTGAKNPWEAT